MRFTWGPAYVCFWLYRSLYSVVGQTVILPLTIMSDTTGYQGFGLAQLQDELTAHRFEVGVLMQENANIITFFISAMFNVATGGNAVLMNIGFQSIAFAGLAYFLQGLPNRLRVLVLLLLMTPSFSLWSSMVSKEAIVVAVSGVLLRYIVDIYRNRPALNVWHVISAVTLYVFKPHFMAAYLFVIATSWLARRVHQPATLAVLAGGVSLGALYAFRDAIDHQARQVSGWMHSEMGGSSRSTDFIVEKYDVFFRAPAGIWRSLVGPTVAELADGPLHVISYAESATILGLLALVFIQRLPKMPVYSVVLSVFTLFWILFATYPFGLANPGTAIRYRTDYLPLLLVCVAVLSSRDVYLDWRYREPPPRRKSTMLHRLLPTRRRHAKV